MKSLAESPLSPCRIFSLLLLVMLPSMALGSTITVQGSGDAAATALTGSAPNLSAADLRSAVVGASSGDTIVFNPTLVAGGPVTITLTIAGDFTFGPSALVVPAATTLTIQGPTGNNGITISRSTVNMRLFTVKSTGNLTLNNITLQDGVATGGTGGSTTGNAGGGGGGAGLGGAIFNAGSLTIQGCTLVGNTATGGDGGAENQTVFNGAGGGGGGLGGNGGDGFSNSSSAGSHGGGGGGTQTAGSAGTVSAGGAGGTGGTGGASGTGTEPGTASGAGGGGGGPGNSGAGGAGGIGGGGGGSPSAADGAAGGFGGGGGGSGELNTGGAGGFGGGGGGSFTGTANGGFGAGNGGTGSGGGGGGGTGAGGAVFNLQGTVTLINSTVFGNSALGGNGGTASVGTPSSSGTGNGGGVFNLNGTMTLTNVTVAKNTADSGSDLYNLTQAATNGITAAAATLTLQNCIVSDALGLGLEITNTQGSGAQTATCDASAKNIVQHTIGNTGTLDQSGVIAADPLLGSFASNGGPTKTLSIAFGSPAIDAGTNGLAPTTDQRGIARPRTTADAADLGAFEIVAVTSVDVPANSTYTATQNLDFTVHFSDIVNVTGTPSIALTIGASPVQANFLSGNGTNALVFRYPVASGDRDTDGISVGALSGGTIKDAGANNALLALNGLPSTTGVLVNGIATVVTANTANLSTSATTLTINGTGFDAIPAHNSVVFNGGATGTVTAATATTLTVTSLTGLVPGALTAVVTTDAVSSGAPVQVATVVNPPTVTLNTANLAANSTTIVINGTNFDATAANDSVAFNDGAVGTVTLASTTSLTVTFSTKPLSAGSLTAVVTTNGIGSGAAVQVATVTPVVTANTTNLLSNATSIVIAGFSFSPTPGNNSVVFNNGAVGSVTAATPTSLTVIFSTKPTSTGSFTAVVTANGVSSGAAVQVATVVNPPPPSKLGFFVQPSSAVSGVAITPAVTVQVLDSNGNVVTTDTSMVTLSIGTNPGGGTLSGTTSVAAINGVATFSNLVIFSPGTGYTLTASDGALTSATSAAFDITSSTSAFRFNVSRLKDAARYREYSSTLDVIGGTPPYTFALNGSVTVTTNGNSTTFANLDSIGLHLNTVNGTVSGIPLQPGLVAFQATCTDSTGTVAKSLDGSASIQAITLNVTSNLNLQLSNTVVITSMTIKSNFGAGKDSLSCKGIANLNTAIPALSGSSISFRVQTYVATVVLDSKGSAVSPRGATPVIKASLKKGGIFAITVTKVNLNGALGTITSPRTAITAQLSIGKVLDGTQILSCTDKVGKNQSHTLVYSGQASDNLGGAFDVTKISGADDKGGTGDAWKVSFVAIPPGSSSIAANTITSVTISVGSGFSSTLPVTVKNGKVTGKAPRGSPITAFSLDLKRGIGSYTTGVLPSSGATGTGIPLSGAASGKNSSYPTTITLFAGSTALFGGDGSIVIIPLKNKWSSQ